MQTRINWKACFLSQGLSVGILLFASVAALAQQVSNDTTTTNSHDRDTEIENRLESLFSNTDGLRQVEVEVSDGEIVLTGDTYTVNAHEQALTLAGLIQGAEGIQDNIEIQDNVSERLTGVWDNLHLRLNELVARLPLLIIALIVLAVFWLLSRLIISRDGLYRRVTKNPFLQTLLKQITRGVVIFAGFILALEILDATALLGTILGAAGIFGLAIGFAIRDTVENFIASILLSIRQPFDPKDHIVIEGNEGKVVKLTSRETILMTLDGNHIRIPNATVYKGNILNYSRNSKRRFTFEVGIDTGVDIKSAIALAKTTLLATPGVIADPPENCLIKALGDSTVVLTMMAWTDQAKFDFGKVRSEAIKNIKEAFDTANFEMPEPIYRLRIEGTHLGSPETDIPTSSAGVMDLIEAPPRAENKEINRPAHIDQNADVANERHIDDEINKEIAADPESDLLQPESSP